jgi:PPK2 family polyphosphate:nucleotide phosphotransferase
MKLSRKLRVRPNRKLHLEDVDPDATPGIRNKTAGEQILANNIARIDELQYALYAENRQSLLIVIQALDAGGKDGTIRKLALGLNPQACRVTSFKVPSASEAAHDFLWRTHLAAPARGEVGIFNRSHYEDVLVVRVHELVPKPVWSLRYDAINAFERQLSEAGTRIVKFYLHISKDEQKRRIQERLDDSRKHWKFSPADLVERKRWDAYMAAYEDALRRCSTSYAPWYVIPANHNWYRNAAVSQIVADTLADMAPRFPKTTFDPKKIRIV